MRQVACAILYRHGTVLLGFRTADRKTYPSCWDVLGGHVEDGEAVEAALVREVQEEAGVTPSTFRLLGQLEEPNPALNRPAHYHMFGITAWHGGEPRMLGDEHAALRWFPVDDACALPDLALPSYGPFLRAVHDGTQVPQPG